MRKGKDNAYLSERNRKSKITSLSSYFLIFYNIYNERKNSWNVKWKFKKSKDHN